MYAKFYEQHTKGLKDMDLTNIGYVLRSNSGWYLRYSG